jgi:hypothetical protein
MPVATANFQAEIRRFRKQLRQLLPQLSASLLYPFEVLFVTGVHGSGFKR